ncbi:hypothetical protein HN592_03485 [Candidatus Woesearchaeota archaeon]|jgi:hypothetical protein|nr:hypothetical protein [Candidatus Woesearchaeota archaeon]MBT4368274.1 hypothetical protein [Candidatus Woesearchaeota archaeon]MBT4712763.1 hypothetical protein [Candidatus Woesearchaeota archaeon]MBT6639675.1 hypothetical protein [Candidatus Woesearchaeota archaeon]MBT7133847.1 hypothetical protein [Candidatus Woesearchaeota archaeon]
MATTISRDTPLAEITLRKYEKPGKLDQRELVRKLCLSTGLLQPGDSRDVVVDILHVLVAMQKQKKMLNSEEIRYEVTKNRKRRKLPMLGIASSNVRRQLLRLRDMFLVEKVANNYRINENASLKDIFTEKIEKYYLTSIKDRVKEYFQALDE